MKNTMTVLSVAFTLSAIGVTAEGKLKSFRLQRSSSDAHDVVVDINYRLADKCSTALLADKIVNKGSLFAFLVAASPVIQCEDLNAGMLK